MPTEPQSTSFKSKYAMSMRDLKIVKWLSVFNIVRSIRNFPKNKQVHGQQKTAEDVQPIPEFRLLTDKAFNDLIRDGKTSVAAHDGPVPYIVGDVEKRYLLVLEAAARGDTDVLSELNENDVLHARDEHGRGPLLYAVFFGHHNAMKFLTADMKVKLEDVRDKQDRGVLQYACEGGQLSVLRSIIESDSTDRTSPKVWNFNDLVEGLIIAARRGQLDIVTWLLKKSGWGQLLVEDIRGKNGATLLHLLGRRLRPEDLEHLRECGFPIDVTATSLSGAPALQQTNPEALSGFLDTFVTSCPPRHQVTESFLVTNPFLHKSNPDLDLLTLLACSQSPAHRKLVFHPVFTGICKVKWRVVRWWYFGVLALFLAFAAATSTFTVLNVQYVPTGNSSASVENDTEISNINSDTTTIKDYKSDSKMWQLALLSLLLLLAALEILSSMCSKAYINFLRYFVWIICDVLIIVLLTPDTVPREILREISFFTILIPWCMCTKHIGHHYKLAQYYSNFMVIAKTCLRILCVFGSLIIAFILTLHVMNYSEERTPFQYLFSTSLKTLSMMVGDLTIEEFEQQYTNIQWCAVLAIFILILTILLYNMTNALAVSDTRRLDREADLYRVVSLARQILWCKALPLGRVPNVAMFVLECQNYQWVLAGYTPIIGQRDKYEQTVTVEEDSAFCTKHLALPVKLKFVDKLRMAVENNYNRKVNNTPSSSMTLA